MRSMHICVLRDIGVSLGTCSVLQSYACLRDFARVSLTSSNASLTADPACRHYPSPHPFHPSLVPRAILYSASPLDREVFEDPLGIWRPRRMFGIRPQGMVD